MIEKLQYHETDKLEDWFDFDEKTSEKFLKELVQFSDENQTEIKQYCANTVPSEFSSLSIVYQALSEYSNDWNDFLYKEIQRVVLLAKTKKTKPSSLEALTEMDLEGMAEKDITTYIRILDFLTSNLQLGNAAKFNIQVLEVIDWFFLEMDDENDALGSDNWLNPIKALANEGNLAVKLKARDVLDSMEYTGTLNPLSFTEKLKGIFK